MGKKALIIVDVQNDFITGSLAVGAGAEVVDPINKLRRGVKWDAVVVTQDWHPKGHVSFASSHEGQKPFQALKLGAELGGGEQMLWPDHCVQESDGAKLHALLEVGPSDLVIKKGTDVRVDSYSGFFDNRRTSETGLHRQLQAAGITDVYVTGLALDYCVGSTAIDAASLGYAVYVVKDATRGVAPDTCDAMYQRLKTSGVLLVHVVDVLSGNLGPRAEAAEYLRRHNVPQLMEHLVAALVYRRPEDPRGFLVQELEKLSAGGVPSVLEPGDAEVVFQSLDPAGVGHISVKQAKTGLQQMGFREKDALLPDEGTQIGRELFAKIVSDAVARRT